MKKAQIQAMETIIIVIILMLLILFGIWFYARASTDSVEQTGREMRLESLHTLGLRFSYLPELSCPTGGAETRLCIDKVKVQILSEWLTDPTNPHYSDQLRLEYYSLFGDSRIIVQTLYPDPENITLYEAISGGDVFTRSLPISIYNPITGTTELGLLYAEIE